mgnify:CR=1 FL=1
MLFLVSFIYSNFRLLPARDTLSYSLVTEVEANRLRSHHNRMQRFGHGVGYIEYWDGNEWMVKAVPFNDPDFQVSLLPAPPEEQPVPPEEEELEELEAVAEFLPERDELPLLYPPEA